MATWAGLHARPRWFSRTRSTSVERSCSRATSTSTSSRSKSISATSGTRTCGNACSRYPPHSGSRRTTANCCARRRGRAWLSPTSFAASATPSPPKFAFLYIVTATCDGFSQVVGQWLGRRKLAPRLSPGKTVEGLVGGLVAAASVAVLTRALLGGSTIRDAALLGVLAGLAGLAGDLAASWVKRRAGLKDYSDALPGQGGFLDRFDSLRRARGRRSDPGNRGPLSRGADHFCGFAPATLCSAKAHRSANSAITRSVGR